MPLHGIDPTFSVEQMFDEGTLAIEGVLKRLVHPIFHMIGCDNVLKQLVSLICECAHFPCNYGCLYLEGKGITFSTNRGISFY